MKIAWAAWPIISLFLLWKLLLKVIIECVMISAMIGSMEIRLSRTFRIQSLTALIDIIIRSGLHLEGLENESIGIICDIAKRSRNSP